MDAQQFIFEAIGTHWVIDVYDEISEDRMTQITRNVMDVIEEFDHTYSRFRPDSLVTQMSLHAGTYHLPENADRLFTFYHTIYKLTNGIVTPLIGNVMEDIGYDAAYSLEGKSVRDIIPWEEAIDFQSSETDSGQVESDSIKSRVTIKKPVLLDFGAAGKGYLVDLVGAILEKHQIKSFCVDAGGDILYKSDSEQKLKIGLENPDNSEQVFGVVNILNQSICGSAANRRAWGEFHHIMNPKTLKPENSVKATWVVAESGLIADGLATCLFFVEPKVLAKEFKFDYVIVYPDNSVKKSKNMDGELFYS